MTPIPGKRYYVRCDGGVKDMKCMIVLSCGAIFSDASENLWEVGFKCVIDQVPWEFPSIIGTILFLLVLSCIGFTAFNLVWITR